MNRSKRRLSFLFTAALLIILFLFAPAPRRDTVDAAQIIIFPTPTRTPTPINVGNLVWDDRDNDGRQDAGEPGLAGITALLWMGDKYILCASTTTNASGGYTLIAPTPGQYRVRVILPGAADQFSPKDLAGGNDQLDSDINPSGSDFGFTDIYTFGSNLISITTIDAGIRRYMTPTPTRTPTPINVGNFVWDDLDLDGQQDAGEPGMAGVTVQLWNSGKNQLINSTVTNASGLYTLIAPTPGQYRVRVVLPSAADQFTSIDQAGGNDQLDSDINPSGGDMGFTNIYTFASNLISITTIDAGIRRYKTPTPTRTPTPINVGNFIWNDLDQDGVQDAGEPGLAGVTVQLWNSGKTQLINSAVTNASGLYTLIAPTPGQYRVRVILPHAADQFSIKDSIFASDNTDSDINPAGGDFGFTDIYTFASNLISIVSIDAGIIKVPTPTPSNTPTRTPTPTPSATIPAPGAAPVQNYYLSPFVILSWNQVTWADGYELEVDNDPYFGSPEYVNRSFNKDARIALVFLPSQDMTYYWRIGARDINGVVRWSAIQRFVINVP